MKNEAIKKLIADESKVHWIQSDFVQEITYSGTYADLINDDELEMIKKMQTKPWREVVRQSIPSTAPWLYQIIMDPSRSNFLDLLDIKKDGDFLDVGSGWGQVALPLSRRGNSVAFDLTRNRLNILQEIAKQERSSLGYIQGNFITFPFKRDCFDLIVFNGSLEWIGSGREEGESIRSQQIIALQKAKDMLKGGGTIYIGIENSMGAKYLLGTPDDHTGISHITYLSEEIMESKHWELRQKRLPTKTYSYKEYLTMFSEAGLKLKSSYACFPDYKLIRLMVPVEELNSFILSNGIATPEHCGTDGSPLVFQNELSNLYKTMAHNGVAQLFCPSYGFVLERGEE